MRLKIFSCPKVFQGRGPLKKKKKSHQKLKLQVSSIAVAGPCWACQLGAFLTVTALCEGKVLHRRPASLPLPSPSSTSSSPTPTLFSVLSPVCTSNSTTQASPSGPAIFSGSSPFSWLRTPRPGSLVFIQQNRAPQCVCSGRKWG